MKQLILVLLMFAVTGAIQAGDATAGKNKSLLCSTCHGSDGNSISPEWPSIAGQHENYLVKQITEFKTGVRKDPTMLGMTAALSEQDIADLAAYYASLEGKTSAVKENFVALGSEIYSKGVDGVMACTACHGPNGKGLEAAVFPSLSGQQVAYTIKQLKSFKSGERSNDLNGMMRSVAKGMTDEQIEAVSNYISGLH